MNSNEGSGEELTDVEELEVEQFVLTAFAVAVSQTHPDKDALLARLREHVDSMVPPDHRLASHVRRAMQGYEDSIRIGLLQDIRQGLNQRVRPVARASQEQVDQDLGELGVNSAVNAAALMALFETHPDQNSLQQRFRAYMSVGLQACDDAQARDAMEKEAYGFYSLLQR